MDAIKLFKTPTTLYVYFCIFFLSGFSGLIYQSIWSRYLKLFLGNASYAQMVVLIIFMGGMAIGSALAAKYAFKLKNLILWYGICETVIGLFGLGFHGIFTQTIALFFDSIAPNVGSASTVSAIKFSLAALIILPQSILLGATFPLITTGLLRKYPDQSGNKISTLYFLNSFGAVFGVLCSAFILVPAVGLPGAALTSGIINVLLGLFVYGLSKGDSFDVAPNTLISQKNTYTTLFLAISFITGVASFMYEIAWIRMLSMVFGASTDAFEIMLSTFILGLAIGALLIKGKIDQLDNPIKALGIIQLVMGILAALTIPLYNELFEYLAFMKQSLTPTEGGYIIYNVTTFVLSSLIILPTTICAGTTLPLITHILIKKYKAESAIGTVYAFNTIGAIVGVLLAVQLIMPSFGLKNVILAGSLLDIIVGLMLIVYFVKNTTWRLAAPIAGLVILVGMGSINLDQTKMASGVFRHGNNTPLGKVVFHADGKVSTVAVTENDTKMRFITNNGKPDASVMMSNSSLVTNDEHTMYLLGIIPQLFTTPKSHVANIGFGSGITGETVLLNPHVKSLDTIEIEKKVVDASGFFYPKVNKIHTDIRSNIIIDDAKTTFSLQDKKYDLIISEPPNPWVSGVASLFTVEWYSHVKKHMQPDAVFAQWLQGYELNDDLFSLIYNSIRQEFRYIKIFTTSGYGDFCIIASNTPLQIKQKDLQLNAKVKKVLSAFKIYNFTDLYHNRFIADEKILDAIFLDQNNINSDYFPILDHLAPKARYMDKTLQVMPTLKVDRLLHEFFTNNYYVDTSYDNLTPLINDLKIQVKIKGANDVYNALIHPKQMPEGLALAKLEKQTKLSACQNANISLKGRQAAYQSLLVDLFDDINLLKKTTIADYTSHLMTQCGAQMSDVDKLVINSLAAYAANDMPELYNLTAQLFKNKAVGNLQKPQQVAMSKLALLAVKRLGSDSDHVVTLVRKTSKSLNNTNLTGMLKSIITS